MNAKLEILYIEFPAWTSGPYVLLKRWSLIEEGEDSPVSDVIVEWGEVDESGTFAKRHLLCLDAYLSDDELIAIAKTKLPVIR